MDLGNQVKAALDRKASSVRPSPELKAKVLERTTLAPRPAGLFVRYRQLRRTAQIAILAAIIAIMSGFTFAATTYFHYMDIRNSEGKVQHRLYVGEEKDFQGLHMTPGGWRWYDPRFTDKENEAALLVNYNYLPWPASLADLETMYPAFKTPADATLLKTVIAYGYKDLDSSDKADLKAEALSRKERVEVELRTSAEIDTVSLNYASGGRTFDLRIISFNNSGAVSRFRAKFGVTQQFFMFPNEDTVQQRTRIGDYDASYIRNGDFQAVVWEEDSHKLQYTVSSTDPEIGKDRLLEIASGLRYASE